MSCIPHVVSNEMRDLANRLLGLAHLFNNFNNSSGTWHLEQDAMIGIGSLLESFYRHEMRMAEIVDHLHKLDPEEKLDIWKYETDALGKIEALIDQAEKVKSPTSS